MHSTQKAENRVFLIQRPCKAPGCGRVVVAGAGSYCPAHLQKSPARLQRVMADYHRGSAAARGYDSIWQRARLDFLARFPVCTGVLIASQCWSAALAMEYDALRQRGDEPAMRAFLQANPIYRWEPWDVGYPATEVDHIIPHRGDQRLMWSESNWQPLTKRAHSMKTAREAKQRFSHETH